MTAKKLLFCFVWIMGGGAMASAFTSGNADTLFNAYNAAFYATNGNGNCYYKNGTDGGQTYFWGQAEEIEAMLDYFDRTHSPIVKGQIAKICSGFVDNNGSDWNWNSYNDDISWAVIAFCRAYQATGNSTFRNVAKSNFDAMYNRAWDTNFTGGGLWWSTAKGGKNACINGPAAVAACYLYNIYGDGSYLSKAQACYAWERRVLFNASSGAISDSIGTNNSINTWASSYNQGTFVGAANFLYQATGMPFYYQDAILATKYMQNNICSAGIFPEYGSGDFGGFNGIGARWMARFARDQNLWPAFGPWLNANGNAAWNVRNAKNLSWEKWNTATPGGTNVLLSFDCSDSVVILQVGFTNPPDALQVTPGIGFTAVSQFSLAPSPASVNLVLTNTGGATLTWALANTSAWLNVSATSGVLTAGGPATNVAVSLNSAATTNLAAGRYFASVLITNLATGIVQGRSFTLVVSSGNAPIAMTGYNAGVLAPNTATAAAPNATAFDLANNYCFCQAGLSGSTRGLPPDGVFTSQADGTTVFQLAPYGSANALVLGYNYPSSGTLTLTTPQVYNSIAILACSADGNAGSGIGTLVLNFADGTHSDALAFNGLDWFTANTNMAIQGFGRLKLGSGFSGQDNGPINPNMYQTTLNLAALGYNRAIASITFTKPANSAAQQDCGVFAVSGTVMPVPANIVQQPQSTINNQPAMGATFSVVASGVQPLAYQWYYSATGTPGSYSSLASQTNSSLTLSPELQLSDTGSFFVVVTNSYAAVTSAVATLAVYRAPVITQQPAPASLCLFAGSTNTWAVAANAALPVNYYWRLNGAIIPQATGASCRLSNLQAANSGSYSVVVSNAFGAVTSTVASLVIVPAPTYPFGQKVRADGAWGYWRLDETNGTIAHDYLNGNNGTYSAKVFLGQPGDKWLDTHNAARFGYLSSSNSCVTNLAVDFGTSGNAAFSVEAWVNGGSQTTDAGLVTKGYGNGGEQFNLDCGGASHAFRFFVRDAGGSTHGATSATVPNNQWHHLVGVCDELNGAIYLYVDGTNVSQGSIAPYSGLLSSASPVSIGSRQSAANTAYNNQFVGYMEEVAIYKYALTANQVRAHYQAVTNRPPAFVSNPFTAASANAGQSYSATLAASAGDPNGDTITFAKVSGPAWLSVAGNGSLSGTPLSGNVGVNGFTVSATDPLGSSGTATMNLAVLAAPPIIASATWQGTDLMLNWTGGIAPYQLQTTTNLINPAWQDLDGPLTVQSRLVSPTNGTTFYRVGGQ